MVGRREIWTLMYAGDIVLLAEREGELKEMLRRFKKYLEKKSLILSSEKTKVMVFEKRKGRTKKRRWKWGEEELEEVKEFSKKLLRTKLLSKKAT